MLDVRMLVGFLVIFAFRLLIIQAILPYAGIFLLFLFQELPLELSVCLKYCVYIRATIIPLTRRLITHVITPSQPFIQS